MSAESLSVVVEREFPYAPEKIWRALTQPHLIGAWLMKNDFLPEVGHAFHFRADWGGVECQVVTVEPHKTLAYSWGGFGLKSTVIWTLTPTGSGTHLRMEHTGFSPDQPHFYQGAQAGWPRFISSLENVLERID